MKRIATLVAIILALVGCGAVAEPKKFEFVINLKTAKQIGLTIVPEMLARANRLIK